MEARKGEEETMFWDMSRRDCGWEMSGERGDCGGEAVETVRGSLVVAPVWAVSAVTMVASLADRGREDWIGDSFPIENSSGGDGSVASSVSMLSSAPRAALIRAVSGECGG